MDAAYISAMSALAGSSIGAMASVATTWLTQNYQDRSQRASLENARRERLFGEFIDEASKLYLDALVSDSSRVGNLVTLYAILGKLRLFAAPETLRRAERVLKVIGDTYRRAPVLFQHADTGRKSEEDLLRDFTQACRAELNGTTA
jgi:hypothetical protein